MKVCPPSAYNLAVTEAETELSGLLGQERHILMLLDEINQRTKLDESIGNFDLIAIADRLAASARNSLHVKQC